MMCCCKATKVLLVCGKGQVDITVTKSTKYTKYGSCHFIDKRSTIGQQTIYRGYIHALNANPDTGRVI